jgi:hypothetical protein
MTSNATLPTFVPVRPESLVRPARTASARLAHGFSSLLGIAGLALSVPSMWMLVQPDDPLFRPDLYGFAAIPGLIAAVGCVYLSHRIVGRTRQAWIASTYEAVSSLRRSAWLHGILFDIEIADSFPRVLISRSQGVIGLAGHEAAVLPLKSVIGAEMESMGWPGILKRRQPVIGLKLTPSLGCGKILISAGDGLMAPSLTRAEAVHERLRSFLDQMNRDSERPSLGAGDASSAA